MENNKRNTITKVLNFVGGLSGLLSIVILVWKGGALAQMVANHDRRLDIIEINGSAGLRIHEKMDDQRILELNNRTTKLEDAIMRFAEVQTAVKVIDAKLDALKEQLAKKP